ncbi:MAG: hypothetical protein K2G49_02330 [Muribaculum sp.]|nr:hypothetical protein [Muribaculum sp.]
MKAIMTAIVSFSCMLTLGCASSRQAKEAQSDAFSIEKSEMTINDKILGGNQAAMIPLAIVYKTNGNFNDNVPVTLNADRKEIVSFPAPGDINQESAPLPLTEGFLLDRRGINENSAFTRYTYEEYSALRQAPSIEMLKSSIIGGAEVTEIIQLPITAAEAANDTAKCNNFIRNGFPDCNMLLQRRAIQITPQ